jgi:MAF protein
MRVLPLRRAAELVLASASPRRRRILAALGLPFAVMDADVDESPLPGEAPEPLARRLAGAKAVVGARRNPGQVVLGADTVVVLEYEAIGKPSSAEEATRTLERLRAREHQVITAVAAARVTHSNDAAQLWTRVAVSRVWMRPYADREIQAYVASGDPFDKAGSYAVQHPEFRPVARIDGCFLTVVGLPLPEVCELLAAAGLRVPAVDRAALRAVCPDCWDEARLRGDAPSPQAPGEGGNR